MNNLNFLQSTIDDLKEIVQRNQGADHESAIIVKQIELTLAEIDRKARKQGNVIIAAPMPQATPYAGV